MTATATQTVPTYRVTAADLAAARGAADPLAELERLTTAAPVSGFTPAELRAASAAEIHWSQGQPGRVCFACGDASVPAVRIGPEFRFPVGGGIHAVERVAWCRPCHRAALARMDALEAAAREIAEETWERARFDRRLAEAAETAVRLARYERERWTDPIEPEVAGCAECERRAASARVLRAARDADWQRALYGPSHAGSSACRNRAAIAAGGTAAHHTCAACW